MKKNLFFSALLCLFFVTSHLADANDTVEAEKNIPAEKESSEVPQSTELASTQAADEQSEEAKTAVDETETSDNTKINFSEPPYWMMSFDEISDMPWHQKDYYFKKLNPALQKIPELKGLKKNKLKNWVADRNDWEKLMTTVYEECSDKDSEKLCKILENIRIDAIEREGIKQNSKDE